MTRSRDASPESSSPQLPPDTANSDGHAKRQRKRDTSLATHIYTQSYLILFAIFGTLARLGLQALTYYPDAPISFSVLWANVAGCFIMGFFIEDQKLFRCQDPSMTQTIDIQIHDGTGTRIQGRERRRRNSVRARKAAHLGVKKAVPLYIGLTTGFCGCFTSFSSMMRDVFLATSNNLVYYGETTGPQRNGGYSFLALLAVLVTSIALSLAALIAGHHFALIMQPITPSPSAGFLRNYVDRLTVPLGLGAWLAAVLLAIFPPHERWRGQALFALVFAPPGCLLRYHLAVFLNQRISSFPLGTFVANIFGTALLGMCWDLIHATLGGVVGCQVLLGIEHGFCGSLTTVSTWVAELDGFKSLRQSYFYGAVSVVASYVFLVAIMGGLRWSEGFAAPQCSQ